MHKLPPPALRSPDSIRVLSVFAVVVLHVSAVVLIGTADRNSVNWMTANALDSLVRWCIPVFVMLSGALLLGKAEPTHLFYKKRLARLAIPLAFWTVFFLAWSYEGPATGILWAVKRVLTGQPYFHMWFLYMITALYSITPFARLLIASASRRSIVLLTAGLFAVAMFNGLAEALRPLPAAKPLFTSVAVQYLAYFIAGHLIATSCWKPSRLALWVLFLTAWSCIAWGTYLLCQAVGVPRGLYLYDYLSPPVVAMSLAAMFLLKDFAFPPSTGVSGISAATLGVYLIHPLLLEGLNYVRIDPVRFPAALSIAVISMGVFLVALLIASGVMRIPVIRRVL